MRYSTSSGCSNGGLLVHLDRGQSLPPTVQCTRYNGYTTPGCKPRNTMPPRYPSPKQQFDRDEKNREKHIKQALRDFKALARASKSEAEAAKAAFPGEVGRQKRDLVKRLEGRGDVRAFLDKYVGDTEADARAAPGQSWYKRTVYALRDYLLGLSSLKEALVEIEKLASAGFQAITVRDFQQPYREAIPARLREFLPPTIEVNVDESGQIERVTDRFKNEYKTMAVKIQAMKDLLKRYNQIAKQVKADLRSSDEITRLAALITAIIMETGIRPGKEGNGKVVGADGNEEFIETFGAVTLGPQHVRFVRKNFAELDFVGKMTSRNLAYLRDDQIISALQDYVDKARKSGSKYVFVTKGGTRFTYNDLDRYFREQFKGISPTDFRKLRATETVYEAIRDEQADLRRRIRSYAKLEAEELRDRVVEEIAVSLERALEKAREALSHDSWAVTRDMYVNPEILFKFFATGGMDRTFRDAVLKGKPMLAFDPQRFIAVAVAENVKAAHVRKQAAAGGDPETLEDLLAALDDLIL